MSPNLPQHRACGLGGPHPARGGPIGFLMAIPPGPAVSLLHRRESLPGNTLGGLRAQRRSLLVTDSPESRCLHAPSLPSRHCPRTTRQDAYFVTAPGRRRRPTTRTEALSVILGVSGLSSIRALLCGRSPEEPLLPMLHALYSGRPDLRRRI